MNTISQYWHVGYSDALCFAWHCHGGGGEGSYFKGKTVLHYLIPLRLHGSKIGVCVPTEIVCKLSMLTPIS